MSSQNPSPTDLPPAYVQPDFWVTLVTVVASLVALFFPQVTPVTKNNTQTVQSFAILAAALASGWYAHSHAKKVVAHVQSVSSIHETELGLSHDAKMQSLNRAK